jgi:hypothetical protein
MHPQTQAQHSKDLSIKSQKLHKFATSHRMWSHAAPCPKVVRVDFLTLWLEGKAFLMDEKKYQSNFFNYFPPLSTAWPFVSVCRNGEKKSSC